MQQPPQTSPPAPPAPGQAPTPTSEAAAGATAVFPGGSVSLQGVPGTIQEVQGLRERREILRDQLSRATNRREELVSQLNETGNPDARTGLQQRLNLLDERILQIERDQAATEQLLSNAPPEVLAMTRQADVHRSSGHDDADVLAFAMFAFGFGVLLTWFVGRVRRRRRRQAGHGPGNTLDDGRFERLTEAVDAIAEEVERIGEGQRFVTQLLAEREQTAKLPANSGRSTGR